MLVGLYLLLLFAVANLGDAKNCTCKVRRKSKWSSCKADVSKGLVCDLATQQRKVLCKLRKVCVETRQCTHRNTCEGLWSGWGNTAPCSNQCGGGIQPSSRACYVKRKRVTSCEGGLGKSEQLRNVTCFSKVDCPRLNTTQVVRTSTPITTSTRDGTSLSALPQASLGLSTANGTFPTSESNTPGKSQPQGSVDVTTLLAAVLGSLGVVCIVIIAIACIVSKKKKKDSGLEDLALRRAAGNPQTQSSSNPPGAYEEVCPPLPDRPPGLQAPPKEVDPVYESIDPVARNSAYQLAAENGASTNSGYLQPVRTPTIPETIYFPLENAHYHNQGNPL